jgi:hypothetical protein
MLCAKSTTILYFVQFKGIFAEMGIDLHNQNYTPFPMLKTL